MEPEAMGKEEDYRKNAAETVELAAKLPTTGDKGRLLCLAEKWLDLADRAHRRVVRHHRQIPEHPLLKRKFGPQPEKE